MKKSVSLSFHKVLFGTFSLLITINILGVINGDVLFLQASKVMLIPALLILFFIKNKTLAFPIILFFIFSFLGDLAMAFNENETLVKLSGAFYFLSYLCLIYEAVNKFNLYRIDKVVGAYLVVVFLINAYFLYTFYGILKAIIPDGLEVLWFGVKSISLVLLVLLALGKYMANDTKASILFLMVALCLVFSTALSYVSLYYVYSWGFVVLERVIYAIGIYLMLHYAMEEKRSVAVKDKIQDSYNSDNIFA